MHVFDAALKGILLGLFMAISVGPTLFAVIKYSLNHSYKAGLAFIAGVSLSDIMYVTIANVAASWLEMLNEYKSQIAYVGAGILIVVGLAGLLTKQKPPNPNETKVTISNAHLLRIWTSGFLINTINPGVIITWLAAVTATANTTSFYRIVLFGSCLGLILLVDVCKVFLADAIRRKLTIKRIGLLQKVSAICILVIGVALLVSTAFNIHFKKPGEESAHHHFQSKGSLFFAKA
ncbi:LysE family translocator [Polluticoccus soli]|uniref:LysE family translocator n=1 Tax=Polluticoccus soli TaxID=3034150 RepID=UPI0023E2D0F4|nr:LysE family transporter [Flavipsychrobacter sp. JY13-12]